MRTKILVIGSLNMDLVVVASRHPQIGETILGKSFNINPGGKGANQAIALARLGASVQIIGCLGEDSFGHTLRENLLQNGVDCSLLKTNNKTSSGTALITVDQTGRNTIIVVPGANYDLLPNDIESLEKEIASVRLVILQMEIPLETVWTSIRIAKKHSVPVLLNPSPANPIPDEYLDGLDYLVLNESELSSITSLPASTIPEIKKASKILSAKGVKCVILTRGEQGCFCMDHKKEYHLPSHRVRAVDTTAAGDAFIGGFARTLIPGQDIRNALKNGAAAGAFAVTIAGAQTSLPTSQDLEDFIKLTNKKEEVLSRS